MKPWALSTFPSYDGGITLMVYSIDNGCTYVAASEFDSEAFSALTSPPTYSAISALPIADQGWQKVFDQWKEKGLVV